MIEHSPRAAGLELSVLGALQVRLDGQSLDDLLPQKARALLCYLVLDRREHSRSALATLLWGEFAEADAATNLRQALTHMRRALGDYLVVTRHTVSFNSATSFRIDSEMFERSLDTASEGESERLQAAIRLYRGDFLQSFVLRDASAFEEWVLQQRERLHARAFQTLKTLADQYRASGDFEASIAATLRLLALDAWREEAHRLLMWLYVRTGQRSAALAQYQACRRILDQELGVEPMAETTVFYERIKAARTTVPQPIVLPSTPFVGRSAEWAELASRLAEPGPRLLTIVGPGGIGKTRLALQVASEWTPRFLHGAFFVRLASVTTLDAFLSTLVSVLGCSVRGSADVQSHLRNHLADKDLVLVLDNFEQLVDTCADVLADILRHAPEVKVLVTSRERLQLHDERLIELAGLDVPPTTTLDYETYSAVELFIQSARKLRSDFALSATDRPAVARICRLVEGTPLGIELSAAWTRLLSCEAIAREIGESLEFLTTSLRDLPARHRSLRAVFDHSWRLLAPEEQQVLRRLTVFRAGFDHDAAEQVGHASAALLGSLLDKSMVYLQSDPATTPRYDMHEMVAHYARHKLAEAGEQDAIQSRHLAFFLALAETAQPQLVGPEQKDWLALLEIEHDNLRAALQVALQQGNAVEGIRLGGALWRFWWIRGHFAEGCNWLQQVLAMQVEPAGQPPQPDADVRALALHGLGVLLQEQGNFAEAQTCHVQSLALRRAQGDRRGVAFSLNSLGVIAADQGNYARAQALYEESLLLKREFGDDRGIAGSLNNLAIVVSAQGDATQAQALYEESLQLCRVLNDQGGIAVALANLALVAFDQRQIERAEALLEESLVLFQELGDKDGVVECLEGFAAVAAVRGRLERAALLFGATAAMRVEIGSPWTPIEQSRYGGLIAQAQAASEQAAWTADWTKGQQMTPEQAGEYARAADHALPE